MLIHQIHSNVLKILSIEQFVNDKLSITNLLEGKKFILFLFMIKVSKRSDLNL